MSKLAATLAVLMLALPGSSFAQDYRSPDAKVSDFKQDYRSPDARPTLFQQDYRSPDARPTPPPRAAVSPQDVRSPDAGPSGQFVVTAPAAPTNPSSSFEWGFLAAGIALVLIGIAVMTLTQRRRRQGLAIGS